MTSLPQNSYLSHFSTEEWKGQKPQRFKGGRFHNNHPTDELDNLLMGVNSIQ